MAKKKDYKSKYEEQITEKVFSFAFDEEKDNIISRFEFDAGMKPRTCTWLLTDDETGLEKDENTEATDLFEVSERALAYTTKFKLKNNEWEELDSDNPFTQIDCAGEGCGIGITISKRCRHKKCRKRDHYLYYYEININPSTCAIQLTEPDFEYFIKKLHEKLTKNTNEILRLQLDLEPYQIGFRYSTRELQDLIGLIENFKPSHEDFTRELRTAFIRYWYCPDCVKDNKQKAEFGTFQIYDKNDGLSKEDLGLPNAIASFYQEELSELTFAFKKILEKDKEKIYGKISKRWK